MLYGIMSLSPAIRPLPHKGGGAHRPVLGTVFRLVTKLLHCGTHSMISDHYNAMQWLGTVIRTLPCNAVLIDIVALGTVYIQLPSYDTLKLSRRNGIKSL